MASPAVTAERAEADGPAAPHGRKGPERAPDQGDLPDLPDPEASWKTLTYVPEQSSLMHEIGAR